MSLKLGALAGAQVDVAHPARMTVIDINTQKPLIDDAGKECWIDFMSPDSEVGRKLDRIRNSAAFRRARSGRNNEDAEDPVDVQVETLSSLATGWYFGEDAEEFSKKTAAALFADPEYAWLRKASYVWVYAEVNFIKRSSTSSAPSPSTSGEKTES